jgi:hypothetical protein
VPDAVEAARQRMQQEAADELVCGNGHHLLSAGAGAAVILVSEGDAGLVEGNKAAVRDRYAVGVAREIGENGFGSGEGRFGPGSGRWPVRGQAPTTQRFFRTNARWRSRTGSRQAGRDDIHCLAGVRPPPGPIMWTCGWWVMCDIDGRSAKPLVQVFDFRTARGVWRQGSTTVHQKGIPLDF